MADVVGRKGRVMIACVTFETIKIVDPIRFYAATKVHLISYIRDSNSERSRPYKEFYSQVCEMISDIDPNIQVVQHPDNSVSKFDLMLRTVLNIIEVEKSQDPKAEIYINTSAGSSEYTSAATIAAMMNPGTIPFSVNTRDYTIDLDGVRKAYYDNGVPVGLSKTVFDPRELPMYPIRMPDKKLVLALRVLDKLNRECPSKKISSSQMVDRLKRLDIWYRGTGEKTEKTSAKQNEAVYYHRDFVTKWEQEGWIEKDEYLDRNELTDKGRKIIETFHTLESV